MPADVAAGGARNPREAGRAYRGRARAVVVLALAIDLAALNSGNNVFYLVGATLVAMVLLSLVRGRRTLRAVTVSAYPAPEGLFARRLGALDLILVAPRPVGILASHPTWVSPVEACAYPQAGRAAVQFTPERRGHEPLVALRLVCRGPYGITRHRRRTALRSPLLVFPEPSGSFDLSAHVDVRLRGSEQAGAPHPGSGSDFLALREYRPEDGVRRVYWKGFARTGQILSRVHERPRHDALTFRLSSAIPEDTPAWRERFEVTLSRLTAAIVQAHARDLPFRLLAPGLELPPGMGLRHRNEALGFLAHAQPVVQTGDLARRAADPSPEILFRASEL